MIDNKKNDFFRKKTNILIAEIMIKLMGIERGKIDEIMSRVKS